jgi:hypothetical protein
MAPSHFQDRSSNAPDEPAELRIRMMERSREDRSFRTKPNRCRKIIFYLGLI